MERESEFGTIVGDMHSANVIRRDDGEYVVVPQGATPLSRHKLEDLANMLKTLEGITK